MQRKTEKAAVVLDDLEFLCELQEPLVLDGRVTAAAFDETQTFEACRNNSLLRYPCVLCDAVYGGIYAFVRCFR